MNHGRQLRLFLADGTGSGPRFYEIVNRTIQSIAIPATRIKDLISDDWPEVQRPGVYLVHGVTETAEERLYIGKGENVAGRVQVHPEKLDFDVTTLILFTSKDENLNASQVGWLESVLITAAKEAKRIPIANKNVPTTPTLPKAELATVREFLEDLKLIAETASFDYFKQPKSANNKNKSISGPKFELRQKSKGLVAIGFSSDEGFIVKAGSDASVKVNEKSLSDGYSSLRDKLISQEVLVPKPDASELLVFAVDYAFTAPSAAAAVIMGNNASGNAVWKTETDQTLGEYLLQQQASPQEQP